VFTSMLEWLDHRVGVRKLMGAMLLEGVPGGAKWRYVWGSCLVFVFSIQVITGILLMTAYSPSASQAWNSVHAIQYKMDFGWLIRGLHHFGSQTMMVLIALHMLQVVIAGAHLPPREVNWWLGMGLLAVTFGLSLTGYLLPWDQKGYWATTVATNIAGTLPEVGGEVRQQAVGGADYGNYTLTRFYALHVALLPITLIGLLIAHITIFRRHGVTTPENQEGLVTRPENEHAPGTESFWPRQAFFDMIACMVVFTLMFGATLYGFAHPVQPMPSPDGEEPGWYDTIARWGTQGKGAELDAAADRDTSNYPARPEWYFLFLFQLLKYFPGEHALWGTVIIPNGVALLLVILPIFGYGPLRKFGHFVGMLVVMSLLICVGMLTLFALRDDRPDGILWGLLKNTDKDAVEKAKKHQHAVHDAEEKARRACQLAMAGAPVEGGHVLLRNDPYTTGRELFFQRCGSCHAFTSREDDNFTRFLLSVDSELQPDLDKGDVADLRKVLLEKKIPFSDKVQVKPLEEGQRWRIEDHGTPRTYFVVRRGVELDVLTTSMTDGKTASDLGDFASEAWIRGLLKDPMNVKYFGLVKRPETNDEGKVINGPDGKPNMVHALTRMKAWREGIDVTQEKWKFNDKQRIDQQEKEFDDIARWLADLRKPREHVDRSKQRDNALAEKGVKAFFTKANKCQTCHTVEIKQEGKWVKEGGESGPDLTDYGSAEWIRSMIMRPMHPTRYGEKNRMPAFRNIEGPGSELALKEFRESNPGVKDQEILPLTDLERELIIRWMLRDYRPIYGGAPIR
jgi:quinol-cytochrome oxidoreductase complex cytochrome b subunit/mono/diheme cytochrome c family protein